jgi:DNA-binding response OmpR family regulator
MAAHKVIIVEDELAIASMYEFKLKQSGYDVRCAHNGKAGLLLAEEFSPEVVLLDLKMPVMNGELMLQLMRDSEWGKDMRVIILTNISKDEAPSILRFLNVDRYVVKAHHTPAQIVGMVDELI